MLFSRLFVSTMENFTCQMCKEFLPRKHQHVWLSSRFSLYRGCRMTKKEVDVRSWKVDGSTIPHHIIHLMISSRRFGLVKSFDFCYALDGSSRLHSSPLSLVLSHCHIFFPLGVRLIIDVYFVSNVKSRMKYKLLEICKLYFE